MLHPKVRRPDVGHGSANGSDRRGSSPRTLRPRSGFGFIGAVLATGVLMTSAGACVGDIGGGGTDGGGGGTVGPGGIVPAAATLHRLTQPQLERSWQDLLGAPLVLPEDLPADDVLYGFSSISAAQSTVSPVDAETYERATYQVLDQIWLDAARRDAFVGCAPSSVSDPCARDFVERFAARAWRRPVTSDEVTALTSLGADVQGDLGDPLRSLEFVAAAVLLSPNFLFRVEVGEPSTDGYRYTSWEMASRLSYLLTDAPPDDELREAAAADALIEASEVRAQAERLLEDPRARTTLVRFFRDFMNIGKLDELDKSPDRFPQFSVTLGPAMRVEIERMFEENVFERNSDFRKLFTTRETYVNEELAAIYGIDGITGADWVPVTLPDDGRRAGVLTTPGFLALNAHKTQTSPTRRGRFVRLNLLCQDIPPPPPGVSTTLPEPDPANPLTLRERLDEHRENPECAGCHARMDPIGFALESFDAIGAYREVDEAGLPVDSSTEIDGRPVEGGAEMAELVGALPEVGACVARRFYEHAGAHLAGDGEAVSVEELVDGFVEGDFRFRELVLALVTNDGYRYASVPTGAEEVKP